MRAITLGNQRLLVNLDGRGLVRDIYFKRVGQENHVLGVPHKIGVWAENHLSWIDEEGWNSTITTDGTLSSVTTIRNEQRNITITVSDIVLNDRDVLLRKFSANRDVRLFIYHYFYLYGDGIGDTGGFDPLRNAVFHYKRNRYFYMSAFVGNESVLADYCISAPLNNQDAWRDAYDGILNKNAIAQGHVDSCIAFNVLTNQTVTYVVCAGRDFQDAQALYDEIRVTNRESLIEATKYEHRSYSLLPKKLHNLRPRWQEIYRSSILLIRAHTDSDGAIIAGSDSENMLFNRDTYCYAWGRDNAVIARAMDLAGKHELTRKYYDWMRGVIEPEGFYMHKHHPDGSIGSSWQAWIRDGNPYLPIQEDETALQLWALKNYHDTARDDFLNDKYSTWIAPMCDFLTRYVRDDVPLPKDCWDLWEERQGIHTWTVAATIAGLRAGAFFAKLHDDSKRENACNQLAEQFTRSMLQMLYSGQFKRFIRRLTHDLQPDYTIDAADMAPFLFGILPFDHEAVTTTASVIEKELGTPDGGIARYQGDYFHRKTEDAPGNAWLMPTLWMASYHALHGNFDKADKFIDWAANHAVGINMLGEQMHPLTGEPLAVCPLTWAHAAFIETMHIYAKAKGWH